ncbi:MAG: hypothetical protein A2X36_10705 [Elusimicrobia bacterium GWA2_69_24]|nr:MAG: hypothetical protein A2X36_10705 [Elusimicrobia bacterium GWA2_69_24]HBL18502.1 hypothetical protein [Elusimicrobiota bacterium]
MKRVDLKIAFSCNNRCAFCVQGDKRSRFGPKSMAEISRLLKDGRKRGADSLVFTGGEPTIQPDFLESVRVARGLGYTTIQVQTNGRKFCYPDFCRELAEAGVTEFGPSLHGSRPEIHDFLTGAPGSFLQTVSGIRNLKKQGLKVITNSVITRANYRDLPELAALFVSLGVDQFQFAFVHILGQAAENRGWLIPRKVLIEPWVKRGLDIGLAAGRVVMTEAIPFCRLRGYESCIAERIIPETVVYDAEATIESYTRVRQQEGKTKGPRCPECAYESVCEGPWKEYPGLFGWSEFVPIRGPRPSP